MRLSGTRILLGVTGGIAAYKSAYLVRLLVNEGAAVRVVMTPGARAFIGPVTLSTLSKNPVSTDFFDELSGEWSNHVELGLWPHVMLFAPLTANTLSKMAHGTSDNLLLATYLSARCPVMFAPAMDLDMWTHPATAANLETLLKRGHQLIDPGTGELASGLQGKGRMAEPEVILEKIIERFGREHRPLSGKKILITAGPTYEAIDPVRFIGNHSTGKMGFALAQAAHDQGAEVTVVHGPVSVPLQDIPFQLVAVQSADEMLHACQQIFSQCDVLIAAAAVADYRPEHTASEKIKKEDQADMTIRLVRNPDILATLSAQKHTGQLIGGFALESSSGEEEARRKLQQKDLDFIVLNSLQDAGAGFAHHTNKISILDRRNKFISFELKEKTAVAEDIVQHLIGLLHA